MKTVIIAGGSIAGLASAKALSGKFEKILILEPDALDQHGEVRKGTPQANHVHGLLKGGSDALTHLFPNLPKRLKERGAVSCDFCQDVRWYINKKWMPRFRGPLPISFQTRSLLEWCIRDEVRQLSNVEFITGCRVKDYRLDAEGKRVVAAVVERDNGTTETLNAEFFIDATGRGSLFPNWLSRNGFGAVKVDKVKVDLGYASCLMELPAGERDWQSILIYPKGPEEVRGATLVNVEDDRWMLTLAGYHNDHPPADIDGYMTFAKTLPQPDIYEAVKDARILTPIKIHKFPYGQRRYYGDLPRFPKGILPVGDTNASLNPLFGQGMSVAALSAKSLSHLAESTNFADTKSLKALKMEYFQSLRHIFATPWGLALGQDFRYPMTIGPKPFGLAVKNALKEIIMGASSTEIIERFYQVVHLVEEEKSFYHPKWISKYFRPRTK